MGSIPRGPGRTYQELIQNVPRLPQTTHRRKSLDGNITSMCTKTVTLELIWCPVVSQIFA